VTILLRGGIMRVNPGDYGFMPRARAAEVGVAGFLASW